MNKKSEKREAVYPLTFQTDTSKWEVLSGTFTCILSQLAKKSIELYKDSHLAVETALAKDPIKFEQPIAHDEDAQAILDVVFESEQKLIEAEPEREETYRRLGRHIREHLSDRLLNEHLKFVDKIFKDKDAPSQLANLLGIDDHFESEKSLARLMKKIQIYRDVESFIHIAELSLSSIKIRTRSSARAKRGNLWPIDRREKYQYLESLADGGNTCPPFTEADLEFLVSQSSLDMLKKKVDLLMNELGFIEPNRLKANYSRLRDHLQRSKQRRSDHDLRRQLLNQMGATPDQIDYISARATYQTMKNLLRLANGNLAISDLMGGKRTIRKLLRRRGKSKSQAEIAITRHLIKVEGLDRRVAEAYARTRKNHSIEHLMRTINFLKENYRRFYRAHWGFRIRDNVLRRALELGLSRNKLSKRSLATKDFLNDLRRALALEEALVVKEQDRLTAEDRRLALEPLKEVLDYETDTDTRKQLYFIYEQFCSIGLCIPKDKLKQTCMKNSKLFPTQRKVQDALEILNGAYRAIGQHGETLCVLPDYIKLPQKKANHVYAHHAA